MVIIAIMFMMLITATKALNFSPSLVIFPISEAIPIGPEVFLRDIFPVTSPPRLLQTVFIVEAVSENVALIRFIKFF